MKKLVLLMTTLLLALMLVFTPVLAEEAPSEATEAPAATEVAEAEATEAPATTEVAEAEATEAPAADDAAEAEEPEEEESWASEAFGDLTGMKWYTAVILVVLVVMGIVMGGSRQKWNSRQIAYAAMCIAIAFVLSCIKLFRMPQGGSVTPAAMLPLILFTLAFGPAKGLVTGCAFGLLQLIEDPYVIHPVQLLVDYPLAYGAMAVACLALLLPEKAEKFRLPLAVLLGYAARLVMATISGVVFFAKYAGDQNVLVYSIVYNASYLAPEALIACVLTFIPGMNRLTKRMHA